MIIHVSIRCDLTKLIHILKGHLDKLSQVRIIFQILIWRQSQCFSNFQNLTAVLVQLWTRLIAANAVIMIVVILIFQEIILAVLRAVVRVWVHLLIVVLDSAIVGMDVLWTIDL